MKKILNTLLFLFVISFANAQIADVKESNGSLQIINDKGINSGYINLSSGDYLAGFNNQYVVVVDKNNRATIYNVRGIYVSYIEIGSCCKIKNVTASNILITEGSYTKKYDFKGNYLGQY